MKFWIKNMPLIDLENDNGNMRYYLASQLAKALGYLELKDFDPVISKAQKMFLEVYKNGTPGEHFIYISDTKEHHLTRLALFFCLQSADSKNDLIKEKVAKARAELAVFTEELLTYLERIEKRSELSHSEKEMVRIACEQGLNCTDIATFKNQGYLGLYNMGLQRLKEYKEFNPTSKSDSLYDYMGQDELAINNFRTFLTGQNIKSKNVTDTKQMYKTAKDIGGKVRDLVEKSTGVKPEDLKLESKKISQIKTETKKVTKHLESKKSTKK